MSYYKIKYTNSNHGFKNGIELCMRYENLKKKNNVNQMHGYKRKSKVKVEKKKKLNRLYIFL